ncbi:MAG: F0F1 ATP synthase subunit epsilon [Anaerolineales bacterium]|nr:F0F1 ATP synthase subunit epsilon [Anaerolineales bacterium]MCA9931508.1 F0F1 ATP synthase subunit epsilon [Anaerolineales bacterium]
MTIRCEIVTQERSVFADDVDSVNLPGSEGRMGILPNHTALLTTLAFGEVIVKKGGVEEYFAIGGGFVEIQPDKVIILADSAEHAEEIDVNRAEQARTRAEQLMREGVPEDPERSAQIRASLMRAQVRLDVGRRRRRRAMAAGGFQQPQSENEDQN